MSDVFISYASANRDRVLAVVGMLRGRGVDIWIDENRIPGAGNYGPEIVKGIKKCKLLLLMGTRESLSSKNVQQEVSLAWKYDKPMLPLMLDACDIPEAFAYWLEARQRIAATSDIEVWLQQLINALRVHEIHVSESIVSASTLSLSIQPGEHAQVVTEMLPYLADRTEQENRIYRELYHHFETAPGRPLLFVAHGDRSQCLDAFVDRLEKDSLPRHFAKIVQSDQLEWKTIQWPKRLSQQDAASAKIRAQRFREDVNESLHLEPWADATSLRLVVSHYRKPVIFSSMIDGGSWGPDEIETIREVIGAWGQVPDLPKGQPLLVFLTIVYRRDPEGLLKRWLTKRRSPEIPALEEALRKRVPQGVIVVMLPELCNVPLDDAEHWVRHKLKPANIEIALEAVRALYAKRGDAEAAMPMSTLAPNLKQLIAPSTEKLRGM